MQHSLRQFLGILALLVGITLSQISCSNPSAKGAKDKPSQEALEKIFSEEVMKLVPAHLKNAVIAVKNGEHDINKLFLKDSVDPDEVKTTLLNKALRAPCDPKLVKALLEAGADPSQADEMGQTALHCAKTQEAIQLLYDAGAKLDVKDKKGRTPLQFHTTHPGNTRDKAVSKLIALGARLDISDNEGNAPLHKAALCGSATQVKMLLEAGAPTDPVNSQGITPLGTAANAGQCSVVDLLLEKNADPNGGKVTPLHCAADSYPKRYSTGRYKFKGMAAKSLVKAGAELNKPLGDDKYTPLHLAIRIGLSGIEVAEVLLSAGADPNPRSTTGATPLILAAEISAFEEGGFAIPLLLRHKADPNVVDNHRRTALHVAAKLDNWRNAQELLKVTGIVLDNKDDQGQTPLHLAATKGSWSMVCKLLDAGANPDITDNQGHKPLYYAEKHSDQSVANLFRNHVSP